MGTDLPISGPSYQALLAWGRQQLSSAGNEEAAADARFLLFHAAGFQSADLIMKSDDPAPSDVQISYRGLIERRLAYEPVSLILGSVDFMGLEFRSDERALAPRQDSERLVELALERTEGQKSGLIVDLGTGSGCLIEAFLHYRPGWRGVALDKSAQALSLARENAVQLGLSDRIEFLEGEWPVARDALSGADLVISNPPYIPSADIEGLSKEVRDHDPMLALDGGEDGLTAYRDILALLARTLKPEVRVLMEIGFHQAEDLRILCQRHSFVSFSVHKDFSGHNRVVEAVFPEKGLGGID